MGMLRRLTANTLVSGMAFLVTGFVPLLLVPLLVQQYGIAQYGLLVLVRLLLPTGALAVVDFGNSETASYAVAKGRHSADWNRCGRYIGGLVLIAGVIGIGTAVALNVLVPALEWLFDVPAAWQGGFETIILMTSVSFPVLLGCLVAEGIIKGFEDFKKLRLIEVISSLIYAAATVVVVRLRLPYEWAALAFLGYGVVKAALVSALATHELRRRGLQLGLPESSEWQDLRTRCVPLAVNRAIGVGQVHAAPVLIGALLGSSAVGLFDLVTRIPKFLKVVTGTLNSAVLPMVMWLDEAGDKAAIKRLLHTGLLIVICIVFPVVAWGICFSEAILRLWVSEQYAELWIWQAIMFAWPLLNVVTSFTCGALLGRPRFVSALNWIALGQILVQISASIALIPLFAEQAFVAGQIIALAASLPLQLRLVGRAFELRLLNYGRHYLAFCIFALAVASGFLLQVSSLIRSPSELMISFLTWLAGSALVIWSVLLHSRERRALTSMLNWRLGRSA